MIVDLLLVEPYVDLGTDFYIHVTGGRAGRKYSDGAYMVGKADCGAISDAASAVIETVPGVVGGGHGVYEVAEFLRRLFDAHGLL